MSATNQSVQGFKISFLEAYCISSKSDFLRPHRVGNCDLTFDKSLQGLGFSRVVLLSPNKMILTCLKRHSVDSYLTLFRRSRTLIGNYVDLSCRSTSEYEPLAMAVPPCQDEIFISQIIDVSLADDLQLNQ